MNLEIEMISVFAADGGITPLRFRIENELHGKEKKDPESPFTEDEIYKIIWNQIKQVNRKLTNYKCVKKLEIKTDQFEKTSTMKIKRFAELQKDKEAEAAEKKE